MSTIPNRQFQLNLVENLRVECISGITYIGSAVPGTLETDSTWMIKKVNDTGEVIFDTELVKMDVDVENAEKLFNQALDILNGECPEEKCVWCEGASYKQTN